MNKLSNKAASKKETTISAVAKVKAKKSSKVLDATIAAIESDSVQHLNVAIAEIANDELLTQDDKQELVSQLIDYKAELDAALKSSVVAQSALIVEASSVNAVKVLQNAKARIKLCESFAQLNDKTIELIAKHAISNDVSLEELTNYSNYKTSARIAQRACYLTDSALDSRTVANLKLFDNELKRLSKAFDSFSFAAISSKTKITESMLKNIVKSAQFFNLIERTDKRSIKDTIRADTAYKLVSE